MSQHPYDVCIAGAGPAGSTCAFYLARQGLRVLLLERQRFPRDKICGDAVCSPAHQHLRRMGVLDEIESEGLGKWAAVGGFYSPNGIGFVGSSVDATRPPLVIAIRRVVLDEKMAGSSFRRVTGSGRFTTRGTRRLRSARACWWPRTGRLRGLRGRWGS
jgi:flavin-dependent dehydrogenase